MTAESPALLGTTIAYCNACRTRHPARYEDDCGRVVYAIDCPHDPKKTVVSSNPALFTALRAYEKAPATPAASGKRRFRFYLISLTDHCNFQCPICYAAAGPHGQKFKTTDQIRQLAAKVKADGGRMISISGGEPTLHPQLPEIVRILRYDFGLCPVLITNGLKVSEDPQCLRVLKAAGLRSVHMQFDTLDARTYRIMRGRADVGEKVRAIENVRAAGLDLGLVVTVCNENLAELGSLLDYACGLVPVLKSIAFQPFVPIGRFPENIATVTREDVIGSLVQSGSKYHLGAGDFFPLLPASPGDSVPHADCSAHAFLCIENQLAYPLPPAGRPIAVSDGRPLEAPSRGESLTSALVPREIARSMKAVRRRRKAEFLFVSAMSFMCPRTRDEERLSRCIVAMVSEDGIVGLCERGCGGAGLR